MKCPKCNFENPDTQSFCGNCGTQLLPAIEVPEITKTLETPARDLTRGTKFARRYEIVEKLGTGGMGSVYRVEDTKIREDVALKLIRPDIAADKKTIERFSNELKLARKIRHKNVCQMFDLGEAEGTHYITMEYISGEDLKSFIKRAAPVSIERAMSITKQVCEGLAEAHKLGIVHRDLKPSNIMIDKAGNARIMDFGIAHSVKGEAITGEDVVIGTPDYMSPEQVGEKEVDQRSDIYSLGAVLFEMLTGERPFKGDTSLSVAMKHKSEAPPNPKWLNDQIPDRLSRLVLMCLEKDKERRYQSAEDLLSALDNIEEKKIQKADKEEKKKSIAVLPFNNMSADPEQEYFCDGMTEEIISDLSNVQALRVISRSSAMTLKGTKKKIREIAQEVDVNYILEGSVRKVGNNLRITAQLIDGTTDEHLWAKKYRGTLDDVFDIQEKVSRSIVDALKVKLDPSEDKKISEKPIEDVRAYDLYLRARKEILSVTEKGLERALQLIKHGLSIIGDNEQIYGAMGYAYFQYFNLCFKHEENSLLQLGKCADKVFELNRDSYIGHFLEALIHWKKGNIKQAVREYKKTLNIDPNHIDSLVQISYFYTISGKPSAAKPWLDRLNEIAPLDWLALWMIAEAECVIGNFETALEPLMTCLKLYPEHPFCQLSYGHGLAYVNRFQEAYKIFSRIAKESPENWIGHFALFIQYALQDKKTAAKQAVTEALEQYARQDEFMPLWMAECFALISELDEAIDWLEIGIKWGFINYPFLNEIDPFLENIRGEPRFKKLMERVKHEWENFEV
jgi:serine/threonine protein kinase